MKEKGGSCKPFRKYLTKYPNSEGGERRPKEVRDVSVGRTRSYLNLSTRGRRVSGQQKQKISKNQLKGRKECKTAKPSETLKIVVRGRDGDRRNPGARSGIARVGRIEGWGAKKMDVSRENKGLEEGKQCAPKKSQRTIT